MGREELSRARVRELHGLRLEIKRQIASTRPGTTRHAALVGQLQALDRDNDAAQMRWFSVLTRSAHCRNPEGFGTAATGRGQERQRTDGHWTLQQRMCAYRWPQRKAYFVALGWWVWMSIRTTVLPST